MRPESIDLIYIDPPFFSSRQYEVIFGDAQERRAFEDRWKGERYHYLEWLSARVAKMRELLRPTGSIYVHLDWHVVHYMKVEMDRIFGNDCFRNEIVWCYRRWSAAAKQFQRLHDTILFYSRSSQGMNTFHVLHEPYTEGTLRRWKGIKRHTTIGPDKTLIQVEDTVGVKGANMGDVWPISILNANAKERLGYPTQKPEALLQRMIQASTDQDALVADFFCGCGTALAVAQKLGRRWIGCDVSPTALRIVKERLERAGAHKVAMVNYPRSEGELRLMKPFEFQNYVINFVQGVQSPRFSGDFGIDGYTLFHRFPIQVKQQDHVGRPEVQKFDSAIRREHKTKGYMLGLGFTRPAYDEAARIKMDKGPEIVMHKIQELIAAGEPVEIL